MRKSSLVAYTVIVFFFGPQAVSAVKSETDIVIAIKSEKSLFMSKYSLIFEFF